MKENRHRLIAQRLSILTVLVLLLVVTRAVANAAPQSGATEDGRRKLVLQFVKAIQSSNPQELIELVHPAVRACMNEESQPYFDFMLRPKLHARLRIGTSDNDLRITFRNVEHADAARTRALHPLFYHPVLPTQQFQVDIKAGELDSTTIVREIAPLDGAWWIVMPCPTKEGLEAFRMKAQARARQMEDAARRAAELRDPLLSDLNLLLKQHMRMAAIQKYRIAANVDLTTAVEVIDILEGAQKDSTGR